jgi:membrane-associated phospholipid phosphatase
VFGGVLLMLLPQGQEILWLNQFYNPKSEQVFIYVTRIGEWIGFSIPLLYLFFARTMREFLGFLVMGLLILALVTFFKHIVFSDAMRPIVLFEKLNIIPEHLPNMRINRHNSFPSGHTTAAFGYFFYLALCLPKKWMSSGVIFLAALVGVSRMFLVQHFLKDVMAGGFLGVFLASVVYYFLVYRKPFHGGRLDLKWNQYAKRD